MNKLFFSFWWRHFGSSRHMDNSWVVLPTTGAQNQRSTQKQSGGGRGWETKDKFDWITEGGQGIFKGLLGELHIFVFAWLSAAEKPIMGRFAPHESLGAYTCSDCPHSRYKQIKRNHGQFTWRSFPSSALSIISLFYPGISVAEHSHLVEFLKMKSRTGNDDACWEMWYRLSALFNMVFIGFFSANIRWVWFCFCQNWWLFHGIILPSSETPFFSVWNISAFQLKHQHFLPTENLQGFLGIACMGLMGGGGGGGVCHMCCHLVMEAGLKTPRTLIPA